jgi:GTP-binding protein
MSQQTQLTMSSTIARSVALVGRPNVGKSRLFNRLLGRRVAIVHDRPGVTRDLATETVTRGQYVLMDTGGIGYRPEMTPEVIHQATAQQVDFTIVAASVVLLVVDAQEGLSAVDAEIAQGLRQYGKHVLVVLNKMENLQADAAVAEFSSLPFEAQFCVSAEHGLGIRELEKAILDALGPPPPEANAAGQADAPERLKLCLCGRPNVGKSSLGNALLDSERLIVSEVAGTTRDTVHQDLDFTPQGSTKPLRFSLSDTAGVKPKRKFSDSLDHFSDLRTHGAIESAEVALLVLDAMQGVTKHDKKLAGEILEAGVGLIVVVNKWDYAVESFQRQPVQGYESIRDFQKSFTEAIRTELFFLPDSPVVFVSALERLNLEAILHEAHKLGLRLSKKLSTGRVNSVLGQLLEKNPPRVAAGKRFKIYYALQVAHKPFRVRAFCNREEKLDASYHRYLQNGFQKAFELSGCPVRFDFVGKPSENPYYERREGVDSHARNSLAKHGLAKSPARSRKGGRPVAKKQSRKKR